MHMHTFRIGKGIPQFKECDVWVLHHQLFEEGPVWGQLACVMRAALRRGFCIPSGSNLPRPAGTRRGRNL